MLNQEKIQQFQDLFQAAKSILVILPGQPTLDQAAAGLALFAAAEAQGKEVAISSPDASNLSPDEVQLAEKITTELGKRDLCIGFDYVPEAVDKVSYNIDENTQRFYLVIKPQKGQAPLSSENVDFRYTGADADFIILIGVHNFESLNHLYFGYEQLYQMAQVAVLHSFEPEIGTLKLDASGLSSLSEAALQLVQSSNQPMPPEVATNLLAAIDAATDNLTSLTATADTFERVAWLLRAGAFRRRRAIRGGVNNFAVAMQPKTLPVPEIPTKQTTKPTKKNGKGKKSDADKDQPGDLKYQPNEFSVSAK